MSSHNVTKGSSIAELSNLALKQGQTSSYSKNGHGSYKAVMRTTGLAEYGVRTIWDCHRLPGSSSIDPSPHPKSVCQMHQICISVRDWGKSTYINPSIAQETIKEPSWLKLTAVTGSE
jgi:hypothetical protein